MAHDGRLEKLLLGDDVAVAAGMKMNWGTSGVMQKLWRLKSFYKIKPLTFQ